MAALISCAGKSSEAPTSSPTVNHLVCRPAFDSPSVFCRLLDKDKGGHFSICPPLGLECTTKQQYLPSSNILNTRYIHEEGVVDLVDFFPRPKNSNVITKTPKQMPFRESVRVQDELKKWLVRRVECIRGEFDLGMFDSADRERLLIRVYFNRDRNLPCVRLCSS
jgi:GH15 family glucan-1,4-alpha-glucosidase